ncbi:MAG: hypothetical protein H6718_32490 [Polyangiaceae bacterium]|nr:hypothetical protein [Myxococcales bacterium]MCB9590178.1 hypothetical protein [Polyangiaceae bacterium]MCB9608057.1 hypothetical protein [Polyangiaceae bacterium]
MGGRARRTNPRKARGNVGNRPGDRRVSKLLIVALVAAFAFGCAEATPEPAAPTTPPPPSPSAAPEPSKAPPPPAEPEDESGKAESGKAAKPPPEKSPGKPKRLPEGDAPPPPPSDYDGPEVSKRRVVKKPDGTCVLVRDCATTPSCGGEVPVQCP